MTRLWPAASTYTGDILMAHPSTLSKLLRLAQSLGFTFTRRENANAWWSIPLATRGKKTTTSIIISQDLRLVIYQKLDYRSSLWSDGSYCGRKRGQIRARNNVMTWAGLDGDWCKPMLTFVLAHIKWRLVIKIACFRKVPAFHPKLQTARGFRGNILNFTILVVGSLNWEDTKFLPLCR